MLKWFTCVNHLLFIFNLVLCFHQTEEKIEEGVISGWA